MSSAIHETATVWVKASVDIGIASLVEELQAFPGVYTDSSCRGTIGEGGAAPYPPFVSVHWADDAALLLLQAYHTVDIVGDHWGYVRPAGSPAYEWGETIQTLDGYVVTTLTAKPGNLT